MHPLCQVVCIIIPREEAAGMGVGTTCAIGERLENLCAQWHVITQTGGDGASGVSNAELRAWW